MTENKASFFARLEPRLAPSELVKIRAAYYLAKYGHRAQVRKETDEQGNPLRYFEHVRRVALVLMDVAHCYDPDLVCTALLHDALEDTEDIDSAIIEQMFGTAVARRVRLLTKAPKEGYVDRLRLADDETLLVKACDRLDNLRSLGETTQAFREKQLLETVQTYWPLFRGLAYTTVTDEILAILSQARQVGDLRCHLSELSGG
jgi:GTP pyrophosphokinase